MSLKPLWTFVGYIFWWILLTLLSPFFIATFGLLLIWKYLVVEPLARLTLSKRVRSLNPFDAVLATDGFWDRPLSTLGQLMVLEGSLDVEKFCSKFTKTILEARGGSKNQLIYRKMLEIPRKFLGYYFWEAANDFSLKNHILVSHSPIHERDLKDKAQEWVTAPFPAGQPLWEIRIFTKYRPSSEAEAGAPFTIVIPRLHHAISDGNTYIKLIDKLTGNVTAEYAPKKEETPFREKVEFLFRVPSVIAHLYMDNMLHRDWFTQPKMSQDFSLSWKPLPLKTLKKLRRETRVRFSTLGMSLLGGALGKYTEANKAFVNSGSGVLKDAARVMLPLPRPGHPTNKMANHWTMGVVTVPLHGEKLMRTEQDFLAVLKSGGPVLTRWVGPPLLSILPNFFLRRILTSNIGTGLIFTSVLGPADKTLWIGDHRIRTLIPLLGPQYAQTGVLGILHTYNDVATFTIVANQTISPSLDSTHQICNYVEEEMLDMVQGLAKESQSDSMPLNYIV